MLNPRDENIPETCARTPGWFWTRAESTCRIGFDELPAPFDPIARSTFPLRPDDLSDPGPGAGHKLLLCRDAALATRLRRPRPDLDGPAGADGWLR